MLQNLQIALGLLFRVFVQRPSYLMGTVVPMPDFLVQLGEFDAQILQTLEELIGLGSFLRELGELARMQTSLPTSLGGLGARSTARAAFAAFLGSWALVKSLVGKRFLRSGLPFLVSMVSDDVDAGVLPFHVALRSARDAESPPASTLDPCILFGVGAGIGVAGSEEVVGGNRHSGVTGSLYEPGRARLVSETGPRAAAWLTAVSLFQALQIEDECFRTALRTWLSLPYPMVADIRLCECGEELQAGILGGQHLLPCGLGSERNSTHHSIRDTMFYIMREAGYSVRREQSGVMPI
jgi:hypothetical protein